jgi:hypothetical protein
MALQTRLAPSDLEDARTRDALAAASKLSPEALQSRFFG